MVQRLLTKRIVEFAHVALAVLAVGAFFLPGDSRAGEKTNEGCPANSFAPEVHTLFGDAKTVLTKLEKQDISLKERRVFGVIVETSASAELLVFERDAKNPELCTVYHWTGGSAADLRAKLDQVILANTGILCIGEQAKAVFDKETHSEFKKEGSIPAPGSVLAAARHAVQKTDGYLRLSILLLC